MVGPFIFFDQMGPAGFEIGQGVDVRPHPHINLATLTYLFDGQILHRDSLGTAQTIQPGAVNLMTAGRGIVHSERTPLPERSAGASLFGLQTWLALPQAYEEVDPAFAHFSSDDLPSLDDSGIRARLLVGGLWGARSPVATYGDVLYADLHLSPGRSVPLDDSSEERALYVVEGSVAVDGNDVAGGTLAVLRPETPMTIKASSDIAAHVILLGGDAMDGPRYLWWNFVSSRKERIDDARQEWRQGRFDTVPGDEAEFIPLPEDTPLLD